MAYATLMVYVDPDFANEQLVRVAVQLAEKFTSKLIGVSAIPIRAPMVTNGTVVNVVTAEEITRMTDRLQSKEDWFRQRAGGTSRMVGWRSELDFPTEFVVSQARCVDLLIANPTGVLATTYNALDVAGMILKAGRPVLVVPPDVPSLLADRIVIGWKDAREARRAVLDALPFIHEATQVTLAQVCDEGDEAAAKRGIDDVVQYLACHRIKCAPKVYLRREGPVAARLLKLVEDEGADLLVTGAYGSSRLGEWVFGGVTEDLLATSPVSCLMSH
jgi:nucleotide-binding universal stress UspA family protein